jgi:hypothetical protein
MFGRSRPVSLAAVVLPALALIIGATQLAGCGGDTCDCDAEVALARQEGEKAGRQSERLRQLKIRLKNENKGKNKDKDKGGSGTGTGGPAQPALRDCGSGVAANGVTTCGFAQAVRGAYFEQQGSGPGQVIATSATTGQTYTMTCTGDSPHVCTGGNNAEVRFP